MSSNIQEDLKNIFRSSNTARCNIIKSIELISLNLKDINLTDDKKNNLQTNLLSNLIQLNENNRKACNRLIKKIETKSFSFEFN